VEGETWIPPLGRGVFPRKFGAKFAMCMSASMDGGCMRSVLQFVNGGTGGTYKRRAVVKHRKASVKLDELAA
jgi:hypothetical protein